MTIITRSDKLGWDIVISAANGTTVRSIIKCQGGFMIVNGFLTPDTSIFQSSFRSAIRLIRAGQI